MIPRAPTVARWLKGLSQRIIRSCFEYDTHRVPYFCTFFLIYLFFVDLV